MMFIQKEINGLSVIIEQDENTVFVAECPALIGCYTQGSTLDEVVKNIKEVIELCKG